MIAGPSTSIACMKRNVPVLILLLAALLPALAANPKSKPDSLLPEAFAGFVSSQLWVTD